MDSNSIKEQQHNTKRNWESGDFSISKLVLTEGDMSLSPPRLGCCGQFEVKTNSISTTGITWEKIESHLELSRYLNKKLVSEYSSTNTNEPCVASKFRIGLSETDLDRAIEEVIKTMYPGEESDVSLRLCLDMTKRRHLKELIDIKIQHQKGYDLSEHWITMQLTIQLIPGCENVPPIYKWTSMEKITEAQLVYDTAVKLFKAQRIFDAFWLFRQALVLCYIIASMIEIQDNANQSNKKSLIDDAQITNGDQLAKNETELLKEKCISNITACHFQWANHQHVICLANERLTEMSEGKTTEEAFGKNIKMKTLYRRGVAHAEKNNYELAISDFNNVLDIEPSNAAAIQQLKAVRAKRQTSDVQMSQAMKKLFQSSI